ncbi:ATP-binding protein [Streptomyces platensis]|uniref:ATP-binding protein n=1 Tax=Streptomyces platensis TaxID=58346 RepID=UPI001F3AF6D6|nr:ATP-binding protein [Streptomyces platensis]MCF3142188.1 ATP-binding protein [Streptomyces platensis]
MTPATSVASVAPARLLSQTAGAFEVSFTPDKTRVRHMRTITSAFLRKWDVGGSPAEHIVLAVSELVTNAVQHGYGLLGLRVRYAACELRIEVSDGNPKPAELRCADEDDESGRGMFIVAFFSTDWGVSEDGTTTWAAFRAPTGGA